MTRARVVAELLALSLGLGIVLGFYRWLANPRLLTILAPTIESMAILALVYLTTRSHRRRVALHFALAIGTSLLVVFGTGEAFYQAIYRREFVPWTDLTFLPALLNMVFETDIFDRAVFVLVPVTLVVLVVSGLIALLLRALRARFATASRPEAIVTFAILSMLFVPATVTAYVARAARSDPATNPVSLLIRAARQLTPPTATNPVVSSEPIGRTAVPNASSQHAFAHLKDRDIHLFIVESYGHTVMSNPAHRALMVPVYDELAGELRRGGYSSYTGFLSSPAFGGRSWLADATMLTGTFIDTQYKYDAFVASGGRNLTHVLGEAGYHRLLAAPGTYEAESQWRDFYEFDQYLFRYDFGYQGPFVSFGAMPDQFLIHRANQLVTPGEAPLFMNYILVSSHVPFDRVPRYVDDWSLLGDGSIYNELEIDTFENNWLSGGEYPEGYVASIRYTLTSVVEFLLRLEGEALVVIVGDHQPRIPISEPDSSFSVPIHVLSRDLSLVEPFRHYGLRKGFRPDSSLSADVEAHPKMDRLLEMVLDVARGVTSAYGFIAR